MRVIFFASLVILVAWYFGMSNTEALAASEQAFTLLAFGCVGFCLVVGFLAGRMNKDA